MVTTKKYVNFRDDDNNSQQNGGEPNYFSNSNCASNSEKSSIFKRDTLPIDQYRNEILDILKTFNKTVIFLGETGCGKSTQIPQLCRHAGLAKDGLIAVTQPRRVAARTLAERVACEMGTEVGQTVGYKFRFEHKLGDSTEIIYQTEGMLLREALHDVKLRRYSVVIVDEVHERTLDMDILLHVLRQAQKDRREARESPLRLILMSATVEVQRLSEYFHYPKIYYVKGRQHAVKLYQAADLKASENDYLFNAISTVIQLHESEPKSHAFLVFLSGQEEIEVAIRQVRKMKRAERIYEGLYPMALYSAVPPGQQKSVFDPIPQGMRKVVFATNIAETSITIPGIRVIIDSGKVKRRSFSAKNRMDVLQVENISKAQAIQRAGRAGRDGPGKCYRLYTQQDYDAFEPVQTPEILRSSISSILLNLTSLGLSRLQRLSRLLDPPDNDQLEAAVQELLLLKAIEINKTKDELLVSMTDEGEKLVHFPIEPTHAKILLAASEMGCLEEALTVVSFLSTEPVFQQGPHDLFCKLEEGRFAGEEEEDASSAMNMSSPFSNCKFQTNDGDHVRWLMLYNAYVHTKNLKGHEMCKDFCAQNGIIQNRLEKVWLTRKQLHKMCSDQKLNFRSCGNDYKQLRHAICKGLFQNVCTLDASSKRTYLMERDKSVRVRIHPSSCMANQSMGAFVFTELVHTNEIYARDICPIQLDWLQKINAQTSSGKSASISRDLDRIRQMQLVRSSPCSSVSSSSSSTRRRKKQQQKLVKRPSTGEQQQMEADEMQKRSKSESELNNRAETPKGERPSSKNENQRPSKKRKATTTTSQPSVRPLVSYDASSGSEEDDDGEEEDG